MAVLPFQAGVSVSNILARLDTLVQDHVGTFAVAALSARARVHILETFKFEFVLRRRNGDLLTDGVVRVDLRVRHSNTHRVLAHSSLLKHKRNIRSFC